MRENLLEEGIRMLLMRGTNRHSDFIYGIRIGMNIGDSQ